MSILEVKLLKQSSGIVGQILKNGKLKISTLIVKSIHNQSAYFLDLAFSFLTEIMSQNLGVILSYLPIYILLTLSETMLIWAV